MTNIYREDALGALYRAVHQKLYNASAVWGTSIFPDSVDVSVTRPYVVYTYAAGGETNEVKRPDATYVLRVVCYADTLQTAMEGAARITWLLNDQGVQDQPASPLSGGTDWEILTSTAELRVHIKDTFSGVRPIFQEGYQIRFKMEARI